MSTVRAKFMCVEVKKTESAWRGPEGVVKNEARTFLFRPVYSEDPHSENRKFWEATPSGSLELQTVNPQVWDKFENGKEYYLDFTPVE